MTQPFYDPTRSYEENYKEGPFGDFASGATFHDEGEPRFKFLGFPLFSLFGIPAGPLLNANYVKAALTAGFDVPVYKTVRSRFYPCHPYPNVLAVHVKDKLTMQVASGSPLVADAQYTSPLGITNSFGVPSMDPDVWQPDLKSAADSAKTGQLVIGSFQGTGRGEGVEAYVADWVKTAKLVKETGVKMMEANLSCPNEGTANVLCLDLPRTKRILTAVKEEIGNVPLLIKCSYMPSEDYLLDFVTELSGIVQGFSVINTIAAAIVDGTGKQALPGEGRLRSGVCGSPIKWAGLEMVARMASIRKQKNLKFAIVGVGGVTTPNDYKEFIGRGADLVMSATGAMWNTKLASEIKKSL